MALRNISYNWLTQHIPINRVYNSEALESAALVMSARGLLRSLTVTNTGGSDLYLQVHDAAAAPSPGAKPVVVLALPAGATVNWAMPVTCKNGCAIAGSSTAATLTPGAACLWIYTQAYGAAQA